MKKILLLMFAAGLVAGLASCSPKQHSVGHERYQWNLSSTAGDYDRLGRKDLQWDKPIKAALTNFAQIRSGQDLDQETRLYLIGSAAEDAVHAGCQDPLVRYLYCNYALWDSAKSLGEKQDAYRSMAQDMEASGNAPLRKFNANLAAANVLWWRYDTNLWPQVRQFRATAVSDFIAALQDKQMPIEEAYTAAHDLFQMVNRDTYELTNAYVAIEKPLFENWPRAGTSYLIKGEFYLEYAWRGRGNRGGAQLSDEQKSRFFTRLKGAETALNQAWSLNPKDPVIPTVMIAVVEGSGKPRLEMELWFSRAMALNTNNYTACQNKLHYLYPQWYGSTQDMLAFGHECLASTNWGGRVPLVLVDAHAEISRDYSAADRPRYWTSPDVWTDIKAAYEKFALLNPMETRFRYPYASYAFGCHQWADFTNQIQLIQSDGNDFNFNYFGGPDEFKQMVDWAKHPVATQ